MTRPPLRTLMGTTETFASTRRSGRGGGRMRATISLMMMGTMTHEDRLVGEEPAKEMEEDHIRHPEEEEISPVLHPDRRVSLMV